jgi:hypothetical protein
MDAAWAELPLCALLRVLDHLGGRDCVAAISSCTGWAQAKGLPVRDWSITAAQLLQAKALVPVRIGHLTVEVPRPPPGIDVTYALPCTAAKSITIVLCQAQALRWGDGPLRLRCKPGARPTVFYGMPTITLWAQHPGRPLRMAVCPPCSHAKECHSHLLDPVEEELLQCVHRLEWLLRPLTPRRFDVVSQVRESPSFLWYPVRFARCWKALQRQRAFRLGVLPCSDDGVGFSRKAPRRSEEAFKPPRIAPRKVARRRPGR